jgi:hypothetical protein
METKGNNMKRGDKVVNQHGKVETVRLVTESAIYTYENLLGWYHPTNIWKVI